MNTNALIKIIILVVAGIVAIVLGNMLVTDQFTTFIWLGGALVLAVGIMMGRNIWMIVPLTAALDLSLNIPGRPSTDLLGQLMFISFSALLFFTRRLNYRFRLTELEIWAFLLILCVGQTYLRNPVGLNLFGADTVGGRPYFYVGLAFITSMLLVGQKVSLANLKWILRLQIVGALARLLIFLLGAAVPTVGYFVGSMRVAEAGGSALEQQRIGFMGNFGESLATWISAFKNPLKASFHPLWAPLVLLSLVAAGVSGFRNRLVAVGFTYIGGLFYRGGLRSVVVSTFLLGLMLAAMAGIQSVKPLPYNIQRAFSFLPGPWDDYIVQQGQASTDWRVEIWKEVMLTDRWISNKWVGDGLGFTASELEAQARIKETGAQGYSMSGFDAQRESILATGNYHSGPIQTIRMIGYVGLAVLLLAQIRLAVHSHRLMTRYKHTSWSPLTIIVGLPTIVAPFFFVLVFGTFMEGTQSVLLGIALIRMLENNLPEPENPGPHEVVTR